MATVGRFEGTDHMASVVDRMNTDGLDAFKTLVKLGLDAHASLYYHDKPERVVILRGGRVIVRNIRDAYFNAAQSMVLSFPDENGRDYFPYMVLRNHCVSNQGLPSWMRRIIERNNGVVPETWSNSDVMSDAEIAAERGV
jgi:hypothetical protein